MKDLSGLSLDIGTLQSGYQSGAFTPDDVVAEVYRRIRALENNPIWVCLIREEDAVAAAANALRDPPNKSLFGIPFAVKDNIDVANLSTTAACPSFSYVARANATVVQRLLDARRISPDSAAGRTILRASVLLGEAISSTLRDTWGFLKRTVC